MRPEGSFRHLLRKKHWPDWLRITEWTEPRCKTCMFQSGPRRPLAPLRFAWQPR